MPSTTKTTGVFTEEERGAMKERAKELRASSKRGAQPDTESQVLEKIAEMAESDRVLAERLHALIKAGAPALTPKLWYGMPAYARDGKVVCFFQSAAKFKTRYAVLGFSDEVRLDDGAMWPTSFALTELNPATETRVSALVQQAVS
ncbi:iron chaperone [Actinoplanes sp. NPDC004185]